MRAEPDETGQERVGDARLEPKVESRSIRPPEQRRVGGGEQRRLIRALSCGAGHCEQTDERCKRRPWSHNRVGLAQIPRNVLADVGEPRVFLVNDDFSRTGLLTLQLSTLLSLQVDTRGLQKTWS